MVKTAAIKVEILSMTTSHFIMRLVLIAAVVAIFALHTVIATAQDQGPVNFTKIDMRGSLDLKVEVGQVDYSASSDGRRSGDTLYLSGSSDVTAQLPLLEALEITGSGDAEVTGTNKATDVHIVVNGSGDAEVTGIKGTGEVRIDINGSGNVRATGECGQLRINVRGSGNGNTSKLRCREAIVQIAGSGDVEVQAEDTANLTILGSGNIWVHLKRDTIVSPRVVGSGEINVKSVQ